MSLNPRSSNIIASFNGRRYSCVFTLSFRLETNSALCSLSLTGETYENLLPALIIASTFSCTAERLCFISSGSSIPLMLPNTFSISLTNSDIFFFRALLFVSRKSLTEAAISASLKVSLGTGFFSTFGAGADSLIAGASFSFTGFGLATLSEDVLVCLTSPISAPT